MGVFQRIATPNVKGRIEELLYLQPFPQLPVATLFPDVEKTRIKQRVKALPMQKLPSCARIVVSNNFSTVRSLRSLFPIEKLLITTQFLHSQSYYGYYYFLNIFQDKE